MTPFPVSDGVGRPRFVFALMFCMGVSVALRAAEPSAGTTGKLDSIYVQKLRNEEVARRGGGKVYYRGKRFDVDSLPSYAPERPVSGLLRIWGLNYLGDGMLATYWKEGFEKFQPQVEVSYKLPVAMLATSALCTGAAEIGANRKITFTELLQFERIFNYDPMEIPLATGSLDAGGWSEAMCIFVNAANPITGLTIGQLDGIFGAERQGGWTGTSWHPEVARGPEGNLRRWGQVGLTGDWADKPIHPFGAVIRYDTSTKFADAVLHGSDKWNETTRMYGNFAKPDGSWGSWQAGITADLGNDRYGIGYEGHFNLTPKLKIIGIQFKDGGPFVEPTLETIQSREYALLQANYFYINRPPGQPIEPKTKEFLKYVLSKQGQEQVIRDGKYLPLSAPLVRDALKTLE